MSGWLKFNGLDLTYDLGLRIGGVRSYGTSWRSGQSVRVPGRLGEPLLDTALLDIPNEIREYNAAIYLRNASSEGVAQAMSRIRAALLKDERYYVLEDSYEPSFYRLAFWQNDVIPSRKGAGQNFELPLRFSCDPRRFIKQGIGPTVMEAGGGLTAQITAENVTGYAVTEKANPVIKVVGGGQAFTLKLGKLSSLMDYGEIQFAAFTRTVWFDVDSMSASYDEEGRYNANAQILDVSGDLHLLPEGSIFTRSDTSVRIEITPRWWVR